MKNLKKFSRESLKQVFGGAVIPRCPTNWYLVQYNGLCMLQYSHGQSLPGVVHGACRYVCNSDRGRSYLR